MIIFPKFRSFFTSTFCKIIKSDSSSGSWPRESRQLLFSHWNQQNQTLVKCHDDFETLYGVRVKLYLYKISSSSTPGQEIEGLLVLEWIGRELKLPWLFERKDWISCCRWFCLSSLMSSFVCQSSLLPVLMVMKKKKTTLGFILVW